jgi:long-chain acyl-CoA synthetase
MARLISDHVAQMPDEPAVIDKRGSTSWAEINDRTNRLIHHLRGAGVAPGDRVALLAGNRREIEEVNLACAHSGWQCVPINWHFAPEEVAYVLENSGATAVLADSDFGELAAEALRLAPEAAPLARLIIGSPIQHGFEDYEAALDAADSAEPDDQSMGGVMFYTSGTTGRPKGVRNNQFQAGVPVEVLGMVAKGMVNVGFPEKGRTLLCGPHYHSAQWAFSFFPFLNGSSVVMQHKFVPEETLELLDHYRITNVHLVPTQFVRLLRVDDERKAAFSGADLQMVLHGAAPCSPDVKRQMIEWWGPKITEYYGATEGGVVSIISATEWLGKPGSVGKPMPNMTLKIVDDDDNEVPLGEEGTIHIANSMGSDFEYLGEPEKTAEAHRITGFFTLGDIGYLDDDGYLYLSDRKIDMIISGGVNIYPAEIEGVLTAHPSVVDVAVFGVPNEEFGEEVKAAVQLAPDVEWSDELADELVRYSSERLARYKVPRTFDVVEAVPRSEAGKLLKRQLRAPYWEGMGRKI